MNLTIIRTTRTMKVILCTEKGKEIKEVNIPCLIPPDIISWKGELFLIFTTRNDVPTFWRRKPYELNI